MIGSKWGNFPASSFSWSPCHLTVKSEQTQNLRLRFNFKIISFFQFVYFILEAKRDHVGQQNPKRSEAIVILHEN